MPQLDPFVFFDEAFTAAIFFLVFYQYFLAWFAPVTLRVRVLLWVLNARAAARLAFLAHRAGAPHAPLPALRPALAREGGVSEGGLFP